MNGTRRFLRTALGLGLLACLAGAPVIAQQSAERQEQREQHRQDIEERIHARFTTMLRSELALSDEQAELVLPAMEELERLKRDTGRERREAAHALRTGMDEGATDRELEDMLERLERIDDDLRVAEKSAMAGIDDELTVRQRVQLRFFVHHFRSELRSRMGRGGDRMERRKMRLEGSPRPNGR